MERQLDSLISGFEDGTISRRQLLAALTALTLTPTAQSAGFVGKSLNHVTLAVSDIDRSREFYEAVLGTSVVSTQSNGVNLGLGDAFLGIYKIETKQVPREAISRSISNVALGALNIDDIPSAETWGELSSR